MLSRLSFENKLRLLFFLGAAVAHIIAALVPAFDTSHLIPLQRRPGFPKQSGDESPGLKLDGRYRDDHLVDPMVESLRLTPSPTLRWDALHYLDVAVYGTYAYEHQYAFSPGVPIVLRLVHALKVYAIRLLLRTGTDNFASLAWISHENSWIIQIIDSCLIALLATQSCLSVYSLTEKITRSKDFAFLSLLVYIMMGAPPIVIRSVYAEPFFAWFSFQGMSACHEKRYFVASIYFALATCFRANGMLLSGFILYSLIVQPILLEVVSDPKNAYLESPLAMMRLLWRGLHFRRIFYGLTLTIVALSPFIVQQFLAYVTFCHIPDSSAASPVYPRPWCATRLPMIYSFVQSHYWDVGLWRYWTLAQLPNFLLAIPMLALVGGSSACFLWHACRIISSPTRHTDSKKPPRPATSELSFSPLTVLTLLPYALHALALSLLLFTAAHVQIALRVLPAATPWAAWAGAALVMQGAKLKSSSSSFWPFISHLWIGWSILWLFVSSILWLAFLPPA